MRERNILQRNDEEQKKGAKNTEVISPACNSYPEKSYDSKYRQQRQTILNLYYSGIPTYIIAFQLDINEKDVHEVIRSISNDENSASSPSLYWYHY